jgi:hypothetical protein
VNFSHTKFSFFKRLTYAQEKQEYLDKVTKQNQVGFKVFKRQIKKDDSCKRSDSTHHPSLQEAVIEEGKA